MFGHRSLNPLEASQALVESLEQLKIKLRIPQLSDWSVGIENRILDQTGLKNNPAFLERDDIISLLVQSGVKEAD